MDTDATRSTLSVPSASGPARLEIYSSAYTLSDMEIFVFPQLLYGLMLANVMSEKLWAWRADPWFEGVEAMPPEKRVMRLKQYIMDHYTFNLDLETWGLTTKEAELARFREHVDENILRESNALFGYEGDKYYFSIDIRRHFGLDRYTTDIIPYWKTETMQAMDAFVRKPGWRTGGGECVSLAALYAAALFVVARIPLDDIWLFATPLHSQNYIDVGDGILTNNRRVVTKVMFFNGSELSQKARRALENEKITVVAHRSGWIHTMYPEATINMEAYGRFGQRLSRYLRSPFNPEVFGNFIRCHPDFQRCFCYRHKAEGGGELYIECEKALRYEESTKLRVSDQSRKKLLSLIDRDEFYPGPIPGRLVVNDLEEFIRSEKIDFDKPEDCFRLQARFCSACNESCNILQALQQFVHIVPRLPDVAGKRPVSSQPVELSPEMDRETVVRVLGEQRATNESVDLAFHAARIPGDWFEPYWHAALNRNPVSIEGSAACDTLDAVAAELASMDTESIYEGERIAQPDEVWNFRTGDGFEKAAALANIARSRGASGLVLLREGDRVRLQAGDQVWEFVSAKPMPDARWVLG